MRTSARHSRFARGQFCKKAGTFGLPFSFVEKSCGRHGRCCRCDTERTDQPACISGKDEKTQSRAVPGFVIPVRAIFDSEANIAAMQGLVR